MARRSIAIYNEKIFNAVTISASGNSSSQKIDLRSLACEGFFSLQYAITGDGTCKFEYNLSNEDEATTMIEPSSATDIGSSLTKTSGPGSNGIDLLSFSPELARWLLIKCTETGGANSVTITAWIAIA